MRRSIVIAAALALSGGCGRCLAQSSTNVVTKAQDAFGERIGLEQIGLYNESQVRGFSLAQAGNYRLDGVYFEPLTPPANPVIAGVTTKVGWNALSADFPAPSGVVDYRLRSAPPGTHAQVEVGVLERWSPHLFATGSTRTADGVWGVSGGLLIEPDETRRDGQRVDQYAVGVVPEWHPNQTTSIKAYYSFYSYRSGGDWGFVATQPVLPPKPHYPGRYIASWSRYHPKQTNAGVIGQTVLGRWDLHAAVFYSGIALNPVDYTILTIDGVGQGRATGVFSHHGTSNAWSGAFKASYRFANGDRFFAAVRDRRTTLHTPQADLFDLGPFDIAQGLAPSALPAVGPTVRTDDVVQQVTVAAGYQRQVGDWLQLRAGVRKSDYRKTVTPPGLPARRITDTPWLFNAAAVFALSRRSTLFATYTQGIEESGSAPASAVNRYAALPAVIARQAELGLHTQLTARLALIASAFQIEKPTPGYDPNGVFRLISKERHRGVELSLTGRVWHRLTAVAGAVWLRARLSGELVDRGLIADRPVGVSSVLAVANLSYAFAALPGLSLDAHASYTGDRLVHADGDLTAPGFWIADLGGRYRFRLAGHRTVLRVYISNLFNQDAWQVSTAEILTPTVSRAARATLTIKF